MDIDKTRAKLLQATLPHVAFDGWTEKALLAGAAELDLDQAEALNAFPGGPAELIEYFSSEADRRLLAELEKRDLAGMRVRERVALGVRLRLEQLAPHREAVRRGLGFLSLPQHVGLGLACLYRTVDAIWYAAGDTSTDYNFYSKRILLAGVYSSTLLVWLNDRSEDFAETWAFLERRIGEVLKIGGTLGRALGGFLDLPDRILRARAGPRGTRPSR
ncbi:MAG: COQ9 family protein [Kiloniellales bacterium]|jgi:ubiquinone biosynthesis protein COQ9